jgi:hypothetical protein
MERVIDRAGQTPDTDTVLTFLREIEAAAPDAS